MSGSIKTYTPNFKMIIPEFNVATWHDYIEENFRSIDALFHNLFGINGFSGMWKTNSQYTIGQVLFVGEDGGSIYEGRLVKITQDTNTGGFATFSEAIKRYPNHYEMYADASSAEIFATLAQDWATKTGSTIKTPTGEDTGEYSAKHYAQVAGSHEEACEMYRNLAKTNSDLAKESESIATEQAQIALTQATSATISATNAKTSETNAKTSENNALTYKNSAQSSATSAQTSAQNAADSATAATNAANGSNVQTVVTNIAAINNCSTNMSVIKDAPNQANRAKQQADRAERNASIQTYRNIGDIFFTTRTDTELYGAVECNGGTYNTNDFTGDQAIGNLLGLGKVPYVSLDEYASLVSINGSCRAFGWDGGDSFRVPTIPALLLTKEQAGVVGNGMALGLIGPANYKSALTYRSDTGALTTKSNSYGSDIGISDTTATGNSGYQTMGVTTDPTKSGIVANLDTVQYRAMVQLANEATDEALIAATSVVQDVANLKDASNFTAEGKQNIVGWGIPDFSRVVSKNSGTQTSPNITETDCMIVFSGRSTSTSGAGATLTAYVGDTWVQFSGASGANLSTLGVRGNAYLPKGTQYYIDSASFVNCYEFPLKGVK